MRPMPLALLVVLVVAGPTPRVSAQNPKITLQAVPTKIVNGELAQLAVTIEPQGTPATPLQNVVLKITPPPGFQVDQNDFAIPDLSGKLTHLVTVHRKAGQEPASGGLLLVSLERPQGAGNKPQQITSESLKLDYASEISVSTFIGLGILGVALGYGLRLLLKVLQSIPPDQVPAPEPPQPGVPPPPQPGPVTRFVKKNFYLTDFLVTLGLGYLALVALTKAGHPPDTGNLWYTALAAGAGIGLLTNSELLTRVGARK